MEDAQEPRWLNPEEMRAWLALAGTLVRLPAALDAQLQRDAGVSHFEYQVLAMLSEAPDRTLRMSDLAGLANGTLSRLSHVVNRLQKRGWVKRRPCESDGRITLASLTDKGWDKIVETAPGHVEAVRHLVFDPLTGQQVKQLNEIGRRILGAVDAEER